MRPSLEALRKQAAASRRTGETIARRYTRELRLARQVQRGFLPEHLPVAAGVRFGTVFHPVDWVSGDLYDVHRLDDEHIGIALADATGHGLPAALLTVYIKRALRGKEIRGGDYRILPPDEVLHRLNCDVIEADLADCPFVAALYGVLNTTTLEFSVARAGAPYPVLRSRSGQTRSLVTDGPLVGIDPGATFECLTLQLEPGDGLVLHTDGVERLVAPQIAVEDVPAALRQTAARLAGYRELLSASERECAALGDDARDVLTTDATHTRECDVLVAAMDSGRGCDDSGAWRLETGSMHPARATAVLTNPPPGDLVAESPWYRSLSRDGVQAAMRLLDDRRRKLRRIGYPLDDLTIVTVEITPD